MADEVENLVRAVDHPISLAVFEGPLDLLLFLIRKNEIDIYDIPIGTVTSQYLEVLRRQETLELEAAGDFFVMAATLMYIKSRMLLPKDERLVQDDPEEEGVDPRWELVQQLIEYKKFKEASGQLDALIAAAQNLIFREVFSSEVEKIERPLQPTDRIELWNTFNLVLRRLAEKATIGEINAESITVADRMEAILKLLSTKESFRFTELFPDSGYSFSFIVASFLAILELTRLKHLLIEQVDNFTEIVCIRRTDGESLAESATVV